MDNIDVVILANQMVKTLNETDFFEINKFVDQERLCNKLVERMTAKLKTDGEMMVSEDEFVELVKEVHEEGINETLMGLLEKGALDMSVNESGEIVYKKNEDFNG